MNTTQTFLVGASLLVVFGVGVFVGNTMSTPDYLSSGNNSSALSAQDKNGDSAYESGNEQAATVSTSQLSAGQRQLLESLGIDADEVTVTPEMVTCAEAKLGVSRVEEIKNGATPSFTEGAQLLACYGG